jgi:very-short-patch-repair endonuclease
MPKSLYAKYEPVKLFARQLRKNQTPSEKTFWEIVRKQRVLGMRFLRQYPIEYEYNGRSRFFIADFYCAADRLIVEIDGGIHITQKEYDDLRDEIIAGKGFTVIRIKNNELRNVAQVIRKLKNIFREGDPPLSPPYK